MLLVYLFECILCMRNIVPLGVMGWLRLVIVALSGCFAKSRALWTRMVLFYSGLPDETRQTLLLQCVTKVII